jgi:SHS2 domain-containing protein
MTKQNENIKFLDNIAIADTAFTIHGKTVEELFKNAGIAFTASMSDIVTILARDERIVKIKNKKLDLLLFDFLNELLFLKDSEGLLFSQFSIKISKQNNLNYLEASLKGEKADPNRHKITTDIKAITLHLFTLNKNKNGYTARVVLDI